MVDRCQNVSGVQGVSCEDVFYMRKGGYTGDF